MRVGVLTGGGDCPGLNAVIRAVVRRGVTDYGYEFVGFRDGWRGPLEGLTVELGIPQVRGILPRGGTILGSSRTNPIQVDGGIDTIKENMTSLGVDALVAIGGEDTLGVATALTDAGLPAVGVPKTIDNDLSATDFTFGFDTAVTIATEAIDRLHTTAESHHRILICEVMGRHAGWIALHSGMAGGANVILIPEVPFDLDQVVEWVEVTIPVALRTDYLCRRGCAPSRWGSRHQGRDPGCVRAREALGYRGVAGFADRGAHRQGSPHNRPRSRAAGRNPDGFRSRARHSIRAQRHCRRQGRGVGEPWWLCKGPTSFGVPLQAATGTLKTVPAERYEEAMAFFG